MPGVPSGKGCDACNRQKKKCDQQKPSCSRCMRLRIPCIGAGQQRYKFKQVHGSSSNGDNQQLLRPSSPSGLISRSPSNEESSTIRAFIRTLEATDLRYDLCWGYGTFMREIPKRLGTNPALDAAADALTSASTYLFSGEQSHMKPAMAQYGRALKTLRACLDDPATARSPATLCAILFIWCCQCWISTEADFATAHGKAIVQILATASLSESGLQNEFYRLLLLAVGTAVIFESLCFPQTQLNPWMKNFLLEFDHPVIRDAEVPPKAEQQYFDDYNQHPQLPSPQVGQIMSPIILLPEFLHFNPTLLPFIHSTHSTVQITCRKVRDRLHELSLNMTTETISPMLPLVHLHAYYHRCYGIVLWLSMALNGILQAYDPEHLNPALGDEAIYLSEEMLRLDAESDVYKPLGATMVPLCLMIAWAVIRDPERRRVFEDTYNRYWQRVMGKRLVVVAEMLEGVLDELRSDVIKAKLSLGV
ncbi:hypothetical protein F5884DRAFT_837409 [Xylogone sp. PMI_703]|nr:hypothetical protein F5884DRAFT_837409 [Xylogone sp. PMI_703]